MGNFPLQETTTLVYDSSEPYMRAVVSSILKEFYKEVSKKDGQNKNDRF
jgi:hypothetical protein